MKRRVNKTMKINSILRTHSGLGIIEVMVALGLMTIIGLGTMNLIQTMNVGQNSVKYRSDSDNLNEEIRSLLSGTAACTQSFGGLVANAAASHVRADLKDGAGAVKYQVGQRYGDNSLLLTGMTLDGFIAGAVASKATMVLQNDISTAKQASGAQIVRRSIQIALELDTGTSQIISCIALARMSDGIWQRSAANLNDIFFVGPPAPIPGGNVGIGTGIPTALLDVSARDQADTSISITNAGGPSSVTSSVRIRNFSGAVLATPALNFIRARGTEAAPLPVRAGDRLAAIGSFAWNGANFDSTGIGPQAMSVQAEKDFTPGDEPRSVSFWTTPSPTGAGNLERMTIRANGDIGMGTNKIGRAHV